MFEWDAGQDERVPRPFRGEGLKPVEVVAVADSQRLEVHGSHCTCPGGDLATITRVLCSRWDGG